MARTAEQLAKAAFEAVEVAIDAVDEYAGDVACTVPERRSASQDLWSARSNLLDLLEHTRKAHQEVA